MRIMKISLSTTLMQLAKIHESRITRPLQYLDDKRYFNFDDKNFIEVESFDDLPYKFLAIMLSDTIVDVRVIASVDDSEIYVYPNIPTTGLYTQSFTRRDMGFLIYHIYSEIEKVDQHVAC